MDPFRLCLALGPVAMYLLLLGAVNLSRRSLLVSGVRDAAALALAVSGLVVIGPMELFFPFESAVKLGSYVWLLLLALYVMCVVLWLLLLRPRLVIYNISADKLRPILADVVGQFDGDARWAGDSLAIPGLGVQLYMDNFAPLRQRVAHFRRRQPESRGLAAAGNGSPRGVGSRGSRPQPARPEPHRCRPAVHRRHRSGHCAQSRGGCPLAAGRRPIAVEDDRAWG